MRTWSLTVAVLVLAAAVALHAVKPAQAEAPRRAVCTNLATGKGWMEKRTAWINEQLVAGKQDFVFDGMILCAY